MVLRGSPVASLGLVLTGLLVAAPAMAQTAEGQLSLGGYMDTIIGADTGQAGNSAFATPSYESSENLWSAGAASSDSDLTYFTPRYGGFQIGVTSQPRQAGEEGARQAESVGVGANFTQSLRGLNIGVGGGYRITDSLPQGGVDGALPGRTGVDDNARQLVGGLNLSYERLNLGGSISWEDSDLATGGISYDADASYSLGPWVFNLSYLGSRVSGSPGIDGSDELMSVHGGVSYRIGPGITGSVSVLYAEWENQSDESSEGFQGIAGINLRF